MGIALISGGVGFVAGGPALTARAEERARVKIPASRKRREKRGTLVDGEEVARSPEGVRR